ncbi:MAG: teichoic acid biosynthesis protein [Deltaproteobacteria bacterium]|nr:teichoic acid biosynthesis protein [Deltaproteobacteria bacterium]
MRILYGVVGEGMGHATRSRVVIDHLLRQGHRVQVVVSGPAHGFLRDSLAGRLGLSLEEIAGLRLVHDGAGIDKSRSFWSNLASAPKGLARNLGAWDEVARSFRADAVISDFESWAYTWAITHGVPVLSLDNMQVIDRCAHPPEVAPSDPVDRLVAKWAVKAKLPGADHYLVSSFFFPPVRKRFTTLLPPILRPEVLAARPEPGEHLLVYQHPGALRATLPALKALEVEVRAYGLGEDLVDGNVRHRPFSGEGFVEDLRTARAVVAGGGYSLMGEAVHLRVPMLAVPLDGQYEQELNARWLAHLGYGRHADRLTPAALGGFLDGLPSHRAALQRYQPRDNAMLFGAVDEVLARLASGERRLLYLHSASLGDWPGSRTEAALGG